MTWTWNSSSHPISDIRDWSTQKRLEIRPDFQRKEVWSPAARILLMDTILRKIPIPKIFFQAVIRSKDTYRIVIDGQQRIKAILSFLNDDFLLEKPYSGPHEGKKYSELPQDVQDEFLAYKIDINEIRNATEDVVRDIYLRVNKYTVALNKQELRRADFPGEYLNLSEKLATDPFFEAAKIFTIANSKRMGDVEFVSELLALLIAGPQEKREALDSFYLKYQEWKPAEKLAIESRFQNVVADLWTIFDGDKEAGYVKMMRFKQKADFYSLFSAIDDVRRAGGAIAGKELGPLREDLQLLHEYTEPESEVELLRRYAIQCVSQGNSISSRTWRRDFLAHFLFGTYVSRPPSVDAAKAFHSIKRDLAVSEMCPTTRFSCAICKKEDNNFAPEHVFISWPKSAAVFQLSNACFIHWAEKDKAKDGYVVWEKPYTIDSVGAVAQNPEGESEP